MSSPILSYVIVICTSEEESVALSMHVYLVFLEGASSIQTNGGSFLMDEGEQISDRCYILMHTLAI